MVFPRGRGYFEFNMTSQTLILNCIEEYKNTQRTAPFLIEKFTLFYRTDAKDRELVEDFLTKATQLSEAVNPKAANGEFKRNTRILLADSLAGIVSEYFWKLFLNRQEPLVEETECQDIQNQVDLKTNKGKTIEVRSSCPRKGVDFAICDSLHQFDIIGPYTAQYKPAENWRDYYVRTLFPLQSPSEIQNKIKEDGFTIYLTGGATQKMMKNKKLSKTKTLKPNFSQSAKESSYTVIPFSKALDTYQMKALIHAGTC